MGSIFNKVFQRDARDLGSMLGPQTVDAIITSPPYGDLKDYGVQGQIGFGQRYEDEFLPALKSVFKQCYSVCKDTGALWIVADTFKKKGEVKLLPFDIANICRESGWILSDIIIWDKTRTLPWSHKGKLRNLFEYILFFVKTKKHKYYSERIKDPIELKEWWVKYPERYSLGGKNPSNLWEIPIPVQGSWGSIGLRHFCPFPTELVEKMLLLTTDVGDLVLDPFAGSGMVLAQAYCMRRRYIGFEVNPDYVAALRGVVLPAVKKKWERAQKETQGLERRRREFEAKIINLRVLKYPKSLYKALQKEQPAAATDVAALIVQKLPQVPTEPNKVARVKVTLLLRASGDKNSIETGIHSVTRKPPVSKFGIDADFAIASAERYLRDRTRTKGNYIYLHGRTHYFNARLCGEDLELGTGYLEDKLQPLNTIPPIISNIGMRQGIVKTWQSRKARDWRGAKWGNNLEGD